jgi:hypothetical protein
MGFGSGPETKAEIPAKKEKPKMRPKRFVKPVTIVASLAAIAVGVLLISFKRAEARNDDKYGFDPRVEIGFKIAPVPLKLAGKDPELVGLGSYLVNAVASCNDCHTSSAAAEYAPGGNPYFNQPKVVNAAVYLGGGNDFGPLVPGSPDIVSRNLTPDKTGLPEGGRSLSEFIKIMRTGVDLDHVHPTCSATVTTNCLPPPFDGDLLQIMPWPILQNMSDHDLIAIYEYLGAVPCVEGPPAPSVLHNDCP